MQLHIYLKWSRLHSFAFSKLWNIKKFQNNSMYLKIVSWKIHFRTLENKKKCWKKQMNETYVNLQMFFSFESGLLRRLSTWGGAVQRPEDCQVGWGPFTAWDVQSCLLLGIILCWTTVHHDKVQGIHSKEHRRRR